MSDPTPSLPTAVEMHQPHEVWIIQPSRRRLWLHVVLLLATFVSTTVVGARIEFNFLNRQPSFSLNDDTLSFFPVIWILQQPSRLLLGLPFSLTLMFILLAHEMGHYLYARHYRVYATLPYFVPFPSLIGTLGAFIRIRSPIPSRAALFDIGIAGPIAGFLPACVALLAGLTLSHPLAGPITRDSSIELGFPWAFHLAARALHLSTPLAALSLHPVAVAAWVGMFATALNLLPGGQLDGGHIVFSIFPRFHRVISFLAVLALIPLGKYFWTGWLLWAVLLVMTIRHPAVPVAASSLGRRRGVALLAIAMLALSFTPNPIRHSSGRELWREDISPTIHQAIHGVRQWLHRK
jgi:membrane-associated protease RseP (regulator of RpoE activity)